MDKSIHTAEYAALVALLKEAREAADLSQTDLAAKLKQSQSFVSKMESGDRRLDLVQLRTVCAALGLTLADFVARFEERVSARPSPSGDAVAGGDTAARSRGRGRSRDRR